MPLPAMTVLMPSWYYEKKDLKRSPSILDGIHMDRESRYRREGARFIINVGTKMGLRYDTMATGVVYFHRFYMFHSFKTFPRYVTACCCLFLAGKVEETPKKCKDIIRIAKTFLEETQFTQFGDDPKEEVMTLERILLQTIKFDLQVDHPYGHLLRYAKSLKGDKVKLQNMVQMAWTFINDSLCTTLCLQFEPEVIAIALMYLAGKLSKFEVVDWIGRTSRHSHWWDMFVEGMSIELLEDICHQVLDLYSTPMSNTPQDSPPATPPTKSTRKSSQPPSPVETTTSPAQSKPKEIPVIGQPIPRLEPGELKRKVVQQEIKKEPQEIKAPRIVTEGKAIPTIIHNSSPKSNSSHGANTQPSSPIAVIPTLETSLKSSKHPDAPIKRSISSESVLPTPSPNPKLYTQTAPIPPTESLPSKPIPTALSSSGPPPTVPYTQSAPSFYTSVAHEAFPNVKQPPPQIYPQQFQHPPPPPPVSPAPLPHQFSNLPPFSAQYPPPARPQAPPPPPNGPPSSILPPPRPQGPPPVMHSHPPPGMPSPVRPPRMMGDSPYGPRPGSEHSDGLYGARPGSDRFNPSRPGRGGRMPNQDYGPPRFDSDPQGFRGRRDSDYDGAYPDPPYPDYNQGYPRPPGFRPGFDMPMRPPPRRFPLEHQQHRKPGPRPPMSGNAPPQPPGTSTGIPPVRITGSM